jgi:hypothetical protein
MNPKDVDADGAIKLAGGMRLIGYVTQPPTPQNFVDANTLLVTRDEFRACLEMTSSTQRGLIPPVSPYSQIHAVILRFHALCRLSGRNIINEKGFRMSADGRGYEMAVDFDYFLIYVLNDDWTRMINYARQQLGDMFSDLVCKVEDTSENAGILLSFRRKPSMTISVHDPDYTPRKYYH